MTVWNIALPLASTLIGAGITYVINVRQRRRIYHEDVVNAAIAAVAAAEISVDFIADVSRPEHMSLDDFAQFQSWLVTEGVKAWATKVAQANEALARVLPYEPALAPLLPFRPDASNRGTHTAIIDALRRAQPRRPPRGSTDVS